MVRNKVKLTRKPRLGDSRKLNAIASIRKSISESFQTPSSSAHKLPSLIESSSDEISDNTKGTRKSAGNRNDNSKHWSSPGYDDARAFAEEISMSSSSIPVKKSNRYVLLYFVKTILVSNQIFKYM